jgi:hypothetical protein
MNKLMKNTVIVYYFLCTFCIVYAKNTMKNGFVFVEDLFTDGWSSLDQPNFWQIVMNTSADSLVFNVAHNRKIVDVLHQNEWKKKTDQEKDQYKLNLLTTHCQGLDSSCQIYATRGNNHHFTFEKVMQYIPKANEIFKKEGVDPWYAQSILLVESPNSLNTRSTVGARGPFQLMRTLAKQYGLIINKKVDQRTSLDFSAKVAARFIKQVCIPRIKKGLLVYFEEEKIDVHSVWFRLLILHAYHAGPGNVLSALHQIQPQEVGPKLIQQLWQTQHRQFKNASQNYSQLILAANLILYKKLAFSKKISQQKS